MGPARIALIGGGAVAEMFHLPALEAAQDAVLDTLVEKNEGRARELASRFAIPRVGASLADVDLDAFEAAIVALPHFLHAEICGELLRAGKHVFVEKPMALTTAECDAMIGEARDAQVTLTVGQMRRFCPAVSAARSLLDKGVLGEIRRFDLRDGAVFDWPVASDFQFRKETAGGGVLFDTGAHALDMLLWLLGEGGEGKGELEVCAYRDDAFGGVEADCEIELRTPGGVVGRVELSRTRKLRNSIVIEGSDGRLELFFYDNRVVLHDLDPCTGIAQELQASDAEVCGESIWSCMFRLQLAAWLRCIRGEASSLVPGEEGRHVVELISSCYEQRRPLALPWVFASGEGVLP
jgi:predicted dehydrogenase